MMNNIPIALERDRHHFQAVPEGDTIHRSARTLHRALAGATIASFRSRFAIRTSAVVGRRIDAVDARGKHVVMRLDNQLTLRTHMRMTGSWHVYRPGERWRRPRRQAALVLQTERSDGRTAWTAVGFNVPNAALEDISRSRTLRELGPDLISATTEIASLIPRMRRVDELPLGVALMRQRTVSGIGNVYKSEVCFIERLDPFAPVSSFDDRALERVLRTAQRLLRLNLKNGRRITTRRRDMPLWVYGRSGEACGDCSTKILMRRQGDMGRSTYVCPSCQGVELR